MLIDGYERPCNVFIVLLLNYIPTRWDGFERANVAILSEVPDFGRGLSDQFPRNNIRQSVWDRERIGIFPFIDDFFGRQIDDIVDELERSFLLLELSPAILETDEICFLGSTCGWTPEGTAYHLT